MIIFLDRPGGHSHRAIRDIVCSYESLLHKHIEIEHILLRNTPPAHVSFLGGHRELAVLYTLKDLELSGLFLHFDFEPETRLRYDLLTRASTVIADQSSMHYIPEIMKIVKESKWGFVVITGATDDAIRDYADYCFRVTEVADFSKGYNHAVNVECYRQRAVIR